MTEWRIYSVWNFLTCHIHCCHENHTACHQSACILHLTKPGRVLHNNEKSVWEIYSNLFPEEENVLLILCYCCLFICLRLLILCLLLSFALEKRASAGWALKHVLCSSLAKQKLCEILYLLGVKYTDISYNVLWDSRRTCLQHFCLERFSTAFCLQAGGT